MGWGCLEDFCGGLGPGLALKMGQDFHMWRVGGKSLGTTLWRD